MDVVGKNINLRTVTTDDAEFILSLRSDSDRNKFISKVDNDIDKQIKFIIEYKIRELSKEEYYFVIESKNQELLGVVRIYDFVDDSFCWGSWIIKSGSPSYVAIESALLIYEVSFNHLMFNSSHFDVRRENTKVLDFHKRLGAKIVSNDQLNYYFKYDKSDYELIKLKYSKYLPDVVLVND
ncbi:MAG: GNAT family N-acetyltransferase [Desulfuromonadaceae bacterium]|nr:GNAT family N-acetyltransferase [Desulfuromonadaceae bacterium]